MIVTRDGNSIHISGCFRVIGPNDLAGMNIQTLFMVSDPHTFQPLVIVRCGTEYVAAPVPLIAEAARASKPKVVEKVDAEAA